ncbi:MAG: hypothetical protein AAF436_19855 [Myxococcota bacterium]
MTSEKKAVNPATRILGGLIGGVGTYYAAHWFNAWDLNNATILGLSGAMAVAGLWAGPKIYDVVLHFV